MNCPFYETSALSNIMIEEVFKIMCEDIYNKVKNEKQDDDDDIEIVRDDNDIINININKQPKKKKCCD